MCGVFLYLHLEKHPIFLFLFYRERLDLWLAAKGYVIFCLYRYSYSLATSNSVKLEDNCNKYIDDYIYYVSWIWFLSHLIAPLTEYIINRAGVKVKIVFVKYPSQHKFRKFIYTIFTITLGRHQVPHRKWKVKRQKQKVHTHCVLAISPRTRHVLVHQSNVLWNALRLQQGEIYKIQRQLWWI